MTTDAEAIEIVKTYLAACEARDFDTADGLAADDLEMIFPGGVSLPRPSAVAGNSGSRYRRIGKRFDGFDVARNEDGRMIVYSYGVLVGEWLDGEAFDDIRFIDRFEVADGKITSQRVWNDSGEARIARMGKAA